MNNYHLYEEIGKGKYSAVYKGRKRYTIRYVAVKSIEKNRRDKVMTEVNTLSQLKHSNIVAFINWYETRNHLWIIFEYCAGGDLMRLLKQDGKLPENQVKLFARDISAGLLHVHSNGVIYSDLKPANVLSDEDGILKLSDFGHSQRLEDIERCLAEKVSLPRRGTPHYMAPELLQDGGMHSFSSDLWALGCVIFEMLVGKPPFHSSSFQELQHQVLREPSPVPGGSSPDMQTLITMLLSKSPLDRGVWHGLRSQAYWEGHPPGDDADAENLPEQPHLEELRHVWSMTEAGRVGLSPPAATSPPAVDAYDPSPEKSASMDSRHGIRQQNILRDPASEDQTSDAMPPRNAPRSRRGGGGYGIAAAEPLPESQDGVATCGLGSLRKRLTTNDFANIVGLVLPAETGVKPISRNAQIEDPESLEGTPADLPFAPLRLEEIVSRSHAEAESFFSKVYKWVAQGSMEQKIGALKYLEQISCDMQVADLVANSRLLPLVLRMLNARRAGDHSHSEAAASPALRTRLLSLIGQLLRHATYLDPGVAELGLFDMLLEALRESDVVVRRRSIAALGELLFYIATQPAPHEADAPGSGDASRQWHVREAVPKALITLIFTDGEDEIVQHYAAKTIENIATQCPVIAQQWFFSAELLLGLRKHVLQGSSDHFRLCCLAATTNQLRSQPEGVQQDLQLSHPDLVTTGFQELAPQGVPHSLQLVATTLLRVFSMDAVVSSLPENVLDLLMSVASQPRYHLALRGRAVLLLALLVSVDAGEAKQMRAVLDRSLVVHIDRLSREKDQFIVQCVAAAVRVLESTALNMMQVLLQGLRQLIGSTQPAAATELAARLVQLPPVFLHLLASTTFCGCVLNAKALPLLGQLGELAACIPAMHSESNLASNPLHHLQPLVLMVMEVLATQPGLLLEQAPVVARHILSALAGFLPNSRSDVRLLALKAFSDICMILLNDTHVFDPTSERPGETTLLLEALLCSRVLPAVPTLLRDDPPCPTCALRLVATVLSRQSAAANAKVRELAMAPQLLAALETQLRDGQQGLTVHTCWLSCCLLWGCDVKVSELARTGILDAVDVVLTEAAEIAAGNAAQLDLALVDAALGTAEEALSQARVMPRSGADVSQATAKELGRLGWSLPALAALCAPLAHAKLGPLLDRATTCCQHLVDIARLRGAQSGRAAGTELPAKGMVALLESLAAIARWRAAALAPKPASPSNPVLDSKLAYTLQRRLLAVLQWAVTVGGAGMEIRAEVASGVERLFREGMIGDDATVASDVRCLIAAAVSRNAG